MKSAKKIFLIISLITLIAVAAVGLTACSNATVQGQLSNILNFGHNYEKFEYTVTDTLNGNVVEEGVYSVTVQGYDKGATVTFGGNTYSNVANGILISTELAIGNTEISANCYFNLISGSSYLSPFATHRTEKVDGTEVFKMSGTYNGGTLSYTMSADGQTHSGSVTAKAPFYDNNEYYQMLRGATTLSSNFSFGFNVPVVADDEIASASLTANCSSTAKIKTPWTDSFVVKDDNNADTNPYKENGIECLKVNFNRSTEVGGTGHTAYYAAKDVKISGWTIKKPVIKFEEPYKTKDGKKGSVSYALKAVSIAD